MKLIEAIVRHHKVDDIKMALTSIGIDGITASEVNGFGRQKGHTETYRGTEYQVDFVPKIKIEVVTTDENMAPAMDAIVTAARTGAVGDGKIFVHDLIDAVRIRTKESGDAAL